MSLAAKVCGRVLLLGLALALVVAPASSAANKVKQDAESGNKQTEERLRKDVTFLASDECEGRGPNTKGLNKAAAHIAEQFKKIGLKPIAGKTDYFQPFPLAGALGKVILAGPAPAGQRIELEQGKQFNPLGTDQDGKASGDVVFAGYGITCKNPAYDDYAGLDVKGKVVVVLRATARAKKALDSKEMQSQAALITKINTAQKNGAVAVLLVNDAETATPEDGPADFTWFRLGRGKRHLPAMAMQRAIFEKMLPPGKRLADIEKGLEELKPNSFAVQGWTATVEVARKPDLATLKNVVGVLEGTGPLANETIVVGAHYDHLGYGGPSSASPSKKRAIHHGADDNASGTASMIELARRFAAIPKREGRRLVFIAFSGEELGLFGSEYYCKHPAFPLKETAAMFNLDMVGRLRNDKKTGKPRLLTEGHGTAKPFKPLIDDLAKKYDFTLSSKAAGFGPSDHASFCSAKVPVLFFWTDDHPDYHRPTDTADKINFPGMRRVVELSQEAVTALTKMEKPAYIAVKGMSVRPSSGPRLGIRPGYGDDEEGVEVKSVIAGGIADKAGIKEGDRIVGIAGKTIKDIGGYMQVLGTQKKGNTIEIIVLRNGKKVPLKAILE